MTERRAGLAGILAFLAFWTALFAFAAARSDYSHSTKAISELGVIGAPHALAWNLIGFIVPGVLLALCGAGLATAIDGKRRLLWWLLVASGLGFAGTGIFPAEMHNGSLLMQSPLTIGHILATFVSAFPWMIAAFLLVLRGKHKPDWPHLRVVALVLALVGLLGVFARALPAFEYRPGLAQRAAFLTYFSWYLVMSFYLLRSASARS